MDPILGIDQKLLDETAEDLYEHAPCGYLSTDPDGMIVKVNQTFLDWTGFERVDLIGRRRFQELLNAGGRIYHDTHYAPLLRMQGSVREIAIDIVRADGSVLPALVNSVLRSDDGGRAQLIRTTVFDATDRRSYERELLRARREEREIADELQRSLLSGALPEDDRFELAIEYQAAADGLDVGGDWYDAFWVGEDSCLAVVVGDVVGRGIGAAATMGQLRSALRAIAATGAGPAVLLELLERYAHRHEVGMSSTLVYAEVNVVDHTLRWACAGHPPPLLVSATGSAEFLWDGRSAPLDVWIDEPPRREKGTAQLARGDLLILYTDGMVERRDASIDAGLDRLAATASAAHGQPAAVTAGSVFRALQDEQHSDDMCLLALRLT